jgi:hypothetical protein
MMNEQIMVLQNKVKNLLDFISTFIVSLFFTDLNACLVCKCAVARSTRLETYE